MKPILKLYRGYANEGELIVFGHIFKANKAEAYEFEKKRFKNARSIIRMFRIKTIANADVYLEHNGIRIHTKTLDDGYFKFCIPLNDELRYGWTDYYVSTFYGDEEIKEKGTYIKPFEGNLAFISDIDDTFLVSHTRNFFKKLYILLWKNINDRKIFEDVVPHYQALSTAGRNKKDEMNAFFYVSSSEWNLYDYLLETFRYNQLPEGAFLLNQIKRWKDLLKVGKTGHEGKLIRVLRIIDAFPNQKFVFFGDNSQQDPAIYAKIAERYSSNMAGVYIRNIRKEKEGLAKEYLDQIRAKGIHACLFNDSAEAIEFSKSTGLINIS